jgi:hypothetical protein
MRVLADKLMECSERAKKIAQKKALPRPARARTLAPTLGMIAVLLVSGLSSAGPSEDARPPR